MKAIFRAQFVRLRPAHRGAEYADQMLSVGHHVPSVMLT